MAVDRHKSYIDVDAKQLSELGDTLKSLGMDSKAVICYKCADRLEKLQAQLMQLKSNG